MQLQAFVAGATEVSKETPVDAIKKPDSNTTAVSMKTNIPVKNTIKKKSTPAEPITVTSDAWLLYSLFMAPKQRSSQLMHTPPSSPAVGPMLVQEMYSWTSDTSCDDLEDSEEDTSPTAEWSNARIAANILPHQSAYRNIPPAYINKPDMWMTSLELRSNVPYDQESVLDAGDQEDKALYSELSSDSNANWFESMELRADE